MASAFWKPGYGWLPPSPCTRDRTVPHIVGIARRVIGRGCQVVKTAELACLEGISILRNAVTVIHHGTQLTVYRPGRRSQKPGNVDVYVSTTRFYSCRAVKNVPRFLGGGRVLNTITMVILRTVI